MQVLALVNQKGGCGKTTTAIHLAGALAARGERVLLVDLDPQAHATMGLGLAPEHEPTLAEVLIDGAPLAGAVAEAAGGIRLVPATARLAEFEEAAERSVRPERLLREGLEAVRRDFDRVLLDCPPRADGVLTANALRAATDAVLVVETGAFALQGAVKALAVLRAVSRSQGHEWRLRVLATLFDRRTRFAREVLVALHARFGSALFDTVIRTSVRLREAPALGVPVQVLDPACRAAADFTALAEEVLSDADGTSLRRARERTGAERLAALLAAAED